MLHQFLTTLQTEILSTETSYFLNQIMFLKSFNSVLFVVFVLLFEVHGKQLRSCRDGQLT